MLTCQCDVLVASLDVQILRTTGVELLQSLWAHGISAELATDARTAEELVNRYREDQHCWIIMIKQDSVLKIKSMGGRQETQDVDIPVTQLIPWIRSASEVRDREQREGGIMDRSSRLHRQHSQHNNGGSDETFAANPDQDVRFHFAQTKSKKSNRQTIIAQAQSSAAVEVKSFLNGPIAAVETTDKVIEMLRNTRLSDADSWREVAQKAPMADRKYVLEMWDLMKELAEEREEGQAGHAFIYNFRTGSCIYYDLDS